MSILEKIRGLRRAPVEKSPEELKIEALQARIKYLDKERERLTELERGKPTDWGVNPRFEQINQEIENLSREIDGLPPLLFDGSQR